MLEAFFDDAAVFPPGNRPLEEAVPAHVSLRASGRCSLVGPFVISAAALHDLELLVDALPAGSFDVALTVPKPGAVGVALAVADRIPALAVRAIEVVVPPEVPAAAVVPTLDAAVQPRPELQVFVELPRDGRRGELIAALSGTAYLGKLRTGGVRPDLYPDAPELAAAIVATTRAGLPFKATAGLHHAIRNTDSATGFEQHGFLNVLAAVAAAQCGAGHAEVARVLAEREGAVIAARVAGLGDQGTAAAREQFRSIGTCSIAQPLADLADLDLLPTGLLETDLLQTDPLSEGIPA